MTDTLTPTESPPLAPGRAGSGASAATEQRSPWPTFLTASIAVFLISIDSTVLFSAFGALTQSYADHSPADISWVLNAYTLLYAALLVPSGKLADSYGAKRMFMLGLTVFTAASVACGFAPSLPLLVAARAAQGLGAALLTPASLALVLGAFPSDKRAVAVSLWGAVAGLAAALGPTLGTLLIEHWGWRWAFYINVPPALWAMGRALRRLRTLAPAAIRPRLDLLGLALLIGGVGALTWGVISTESRGWNDASVAGAVLGGMALLVAFALWARHAAAPALDIRLFADRTYRIVNLATLVFGMAFVMMFFGFFFFLTGIWQYSLAQAGLAITPGPLMVVPTAMVCGRIAARHGHRKLLVAGCALLTVGGLMQILLLTDSPAFWAHWLPCQLVTGIAVGMAMPALSGAAVANLQPQQYGQGSAVNQAIRQFGSVLGVAITVVLVGHDMALPEFRTLCATYAGLALLAALLCAAIRPRPAP